MRERGRVKKKKKRDKSKGIGKREVSLTCTEVATLPYCTGNCPFHTKVKANLCW